MKEKIKKHLNKFIGVIVLPFGVFAAVIFIFIIVFETYVVFNLSQINPELLNASIAMILLFITVLYVFGTYQIVEETRKDRKKAFIEKRLEKLYLPLEDIIKRWSDVEIDDLRLYKYLATKELEELLEKYMEIHEHLGGFKEEEIEKNKKEIRKIIERDIERFKQNLAELVD